MDRIKTLTLLLSLTLLPLFSFSQSELDTVFFNENWTRTSNMDSASFYGFKDYDTNNVGLATYYYSTGELHSKQNEINNLKEGHCIWYHKNGKKWAEGNYKFDKPYGPYFWFDENGNQKSTQIFEGIESEVSSDSTEHIYTFVDQDAEFPGGFEAMMQYMVQNFTYPKDASEKGVQGTVYVQFVIEKDGRVSNVKISKGLSQSVDEEAIRLIRSMPHWKPALLNEKPIASYYQIPLKLELQGRRKRKN